MLSPFIYIYMYICFCWGLFVGTLVSIYCSHWGIMVVGWVLPLYAGGFWVWIWRLSVDFEEAVCFHVWSKLRYKGTSCQWPEKTAFHLTHLINILNIHKVQLRSMETIRMFYSEMKTYIFSNYYKLLLMSSKEKNWLVLISLQSDS